MHLVVLRRALYRENPWIAASLLDAFTKAQRVGWRRLLETGSLAAMLPWLPRDLEEIAEVFGPSHWQYGFQENYALLSAMCRYHFEQGLSARRLRPEELFAEETQQAPTTAEAALYEFQP
jgi:4,5-dihydroxyphthalate decarboxylase